jgi:glycosyltransferase involved in cell wall biosynthesis
MKIAFIHKKYIDYRTPVFKLLGQRYNIVFFFENRDRPEKTELKAKFSSTLIFRSIRFSPVLFFKLLFGNFDLYISGELLYTNTLLTLLVSKLLRKPFIIWSEEWYPDNAHPPRHLKTKKAIIKHSSACIAAGVKSHGFLSFLGAKKNKIFIAPNASIPNIIHGGKNNPLIPQNQSNNNPVKILFLGRIIHSKGINFLINAFYTLTEQKLDTLLIVAGDGPYLAKLEELAERKKVPNIYFTKQPASDVDKYYLYKDCDIFVLPSIYAGHAEAWGLVLNEAMYFGKPIVSTCMVGAAYDLIKEGVNGFMVPEKNIDALSTALIALVKDEGLRIRMGEMSRKTIMTGYTWSHMASGFEKAIEYCTDKALHPLSKQKS